jgi:GNAT superfamily N-acetyltransferase
MAAQNPYMPTLDEFLAKQGGLEGLISSYEIDDEELRSYGYESGYLRSIGAKYRRMARRFSRFPLVLYREVSLDPGRGLGALDESHMGISWTATPIEEGTFWQGGASPGEAPWIFKAEVGPEAIDWMDTMWNRFYPSLGEQEDEVTLKEGARVKVVSAKRAEEKEWRPFGRTVTAAAVPIPTLDEVVRWGGSGPMEMVDWGKVLDKAKHMVGVDVFEGLSQAEKDKRLDREGMELLRSQWREAKERLEALRFPLVVYRALAFTTAGWRNWRKEVEKRGFGTSWSYDEHNAYVEKEVAGGHIVVFRGVVSSPDKVDWERTMYLNTVVGDEREVSLRPGARVAVDGWKERGEGEWNPIGARPWTVTAAAVPDQTQSPAFKAWFRGSVVRYPDGRPKPVYHGSTHSFEAFSLKPSNPESWYGRALYFTDSPEDVGRNYATPESPDLQRRIHFRTEQLLERVVDELEQELGEAIGWNDPRRDRLEEDARSQAAKELTGPAAMTYKLYLRIERPVVIRRGGGTYFEVNYNERTGAETGSGMRLYRAVMKAAGQLGLDGQQIWGEATEERYEGFTAQQFEESLRVSDSMLEARDWDQTDEGDFLSLVYRLAGFDGIVMEDAGATFQNMGIPPGTTHYTVWNPRQVKSAWGNVGTWSGRSPRMTASWEEEGPEAEDYPQCIGDYEFRTTCVSEGTGEHIQEMLDNAKDCGYSEVKRHCEGLRQWERDNGYAPDGSRKGLTLRKDWSVSYGKGTYRGVPCYFVVWSAIEHVWTRKGPHQVLLFNHPTLSPGAPAGRRLSGLVDWPRTRVIPFREDRHGYLKGLESPEEGQFYRGASVPSVPPEELFYHYSRRTNRRSIRENGLAPQIKEYRDIDREPGVYLFSTLEMAESYGQDHAEYVNQPVDIWEVRLPGGARLEADEHPDMVGYDAFVCYDPIPPDNLRFVSTILLRPKTVQMAAGSKGAGDKEAAQFGPLYHGTPNRFEVFRTRRHKSLSDVGDEPGNEGWRMGAYFTDDPDQAERWAGPYGGVKKVVLEMKKPLDLRNLTRGKLDALLPWLMRDDKEEILTGSESDIGYGMYKTLEYIDRKEGLVPLLKKDGYDGIIMPDSTEGTTYVAFYPRQIKQAAEGKEWPPWVGVDLDGTLAEEQDPFDPLTIGRPVPEMVEKVKKALEDGVEVRVFTARLADKGLREKIKQAIREYTREHVGRELDSTSEKDPGLREIWDDKARRVRKDEGTFALRGSLREQWQPGDRAWFEYHCYEGHDSADADLWYHSHQRATVLGENDTADGSSKNWPESTVDDRNKAGSPRMYRIRFEDGFEKEAFEDELMTSRRDFCRPGPPRGGQSTPAGKAARLDPTPPEVLYHGTTRGNLGSIQKDGLREPVYLTDDVWTARNYAGMYWDTPESEWVVLKIPFGQLDQGRLYPDDQDFPEVWDSGGVPAGVVSRYGDWNKAPWQVSLRYCSQVRYDGSIPPQAISVLDEKAVAAKEAARRGEYLIEAGWIDEDGRFYPCMQGEHHGEAAVRHHLVDTELAYEDLYDEEAGELDSNALSEMTEQAMDLGNVRVSGYPFTEFDAMWDNVRTRSNIARAIRENPELQRVDIEFHRPEHTYMKDLQPQEALRWMQSGERPEQGGKVGALSPGVRIVSRGTMLEARSRYGRAGGELVDAAGLAEWKEENGLHEDDYLEDDGGRYQDEKSLLGAKSKSFTLLGMEVRPEHRRKGVGTVLATALLQAARAAGATECWLHASPLDDVTEEEDLISFYRSLGFEVYSEDGQIMYKPLAGEGKQAARSRMPLGKGEWQELAENGGWVRSNGEPLPMHSPVDMHGEWALYEGLADQEDLEGGEDELGQAENIALRDGHLRVDRDFGQLAVQMHSIQRSRRLVLEALRMMQFGGRTFLEAGPHDRPTWSKEFGSTADAAEWLEAL